MGVKNCTCHLFHILAVLAMLVGVANAAGQTVERAHCGQDGKAHVVYADHSTKTIPPEEQQVGCTDMSVADDHRTFGWSMQVENCCTSYPISVAVIAMRDGKTTVLRSDQMVWQWHFIDRGNRIAVLSGPVSRECGRSRSLRCAYGKETSNMAGFW